MHRHRIYFALALLLSTSSAFAQRNLTDIPDPDPELERATFIVPDGFEVNLFASDPMLAKPIQMNFDEQGRLWIASSEIYPHVKPGQTANDKILLLEDKDRDGVAESTEVFADGLLIPTGVAPGDGGVYVANSTELLHLTDTDGDGKADRRRVVLSGFGSEDTHHLLHTLRWGVDGCLYMNQSIYIHSHIETPHGVRRLNGGGIWRFRPETLDLDVLAYGFVNTWGHHFNRWGQSFATDGAYGEGINYLFPGAVFVTAPGAKRRLKGLNPGSPKHCGLEILSGSHLPEEWRGNMITNDFRAHRVCRFVVTESGSGYASRQETELIKSKHVAFRPIDVKMGPDGAIYVADWYNPIIQHGEVDFRDPRRDHVHGRIWRITAKGRPLTKQPNLKDAAIAELLDHLKAEEMWVSRQARLQLKARPQAEVKKQLDQWTAKLDPQNDRFEQERLEALWTYQALRQVEPELLEACLTSADHRARAAAVRVLSHWREDVTGALPKLARAVRDSHPQVRLEAVCALSRETNKRAAELALEALNQPVDRFLDFALWDAMRRLKPYWLPAAKEGKFNPQRANHLAYAVAAAEATELTPVLLKRCENPELPAEERQRLLAIIVAIGNPKDLGRALEMLVGNPEFNNGGDLLRTMLQETVAKKQTPQTDLNALSKWFLLDDTAKSTAAISAAGQWKVESLRPRLNAIAANEENPNRRTAAIAALGNLGGAASVKVLSKLAKEAKTLEIRASAAAALVDINPGQSASAIVAVLIAAGKAKPTEGAAPFDTGPMLRKLLGRKQGSAALVKALSDQTISPDIARVAMREAQAAPETSADLLAALRTAGSLTDQSWSKKKPAELAALVAEVKSRGDAHRGEAIYRRQNLNCIGCHAIGGAGGRVGPDLVSVGASAQPDYLLESLIYPNKKVKENYHSLSIVTDEGKVIAGIPIRETETQLVLRDAEDKERVIAKSSIEVRREGRSLMPEGAIDALTRAEVIDLTRFLSELGKVGEFAIGKEPVVRRWERLLWTNEAHRRFNRTSFDSAATDDSAFTWSPTFSRVNGELPVEDLAGFSPFNDIDPTGLVRCVFTVIRAGEVNVDVNDIQGLACWLDGKPRPIARKMTFDLPTGRHQLTFSVNKLERKEPLEVQVAPAKGSTAQIEIEISK